MRQNLLPILLLAILVLAGMPACKKKETAAQLQAQKVQAFRQKQKIEAIKAYTALVTKYPDSEFSPKAQERLNVLGPLPPSAASPTPTKKK